MDSDIKQRQFFDIAGFERESSALAQQLASAQPFPHVVADGLVKITPEEAEAFPADDWHGWTRHADDYQRNKHACGDIEVIPDPFRELIRELSEPRFLEALERVSGIKQLLPDPYLTGGGLHLSGPGGVLSEHIDFHYYRRLNLYRRINVLVYFNEDWSLEDGGCLSLFDQDHVPQATVVPSFGRMAMFLTDHKSLHGFPVPVADGKWRRSVALYYYTATEAGTYSGDETTYFRAPIAGGPVRRVRHAAYMGLMNLSRGIAVLAHLVNPAQGLSLFRTVLGDRRRQAKRRHDRLG